MFWLFILLLAMPCLAQDHDHMAGMSGMSDTNPAEDYLMSQASGTSMNTLSAPLPMLMPHLGSWNLMLMGVAFVVDTQQSGPRGGDKFYSANWFMVGAEHRLGGGSFMVNLMLSLDPATITGRRYPELFQTGETAFGKPLVDAQHPHNFIMGLGFTYAHPLSENTMVQFYYAPVGDPALGPVAFPHRLSASEIPQATLGHHWQDSSHIADNVATIAVRYRKLRLEASGFHGAEPGENRWIIQTGAMDSWAARLSVFPAANWMLQVSAGRLTHPESETPGDVMRTTASLHYSKPMAGAAWASSLIWGRNHDTFTQRNLNSYLAESVLPWRKRNFLTGRVELVDKDELFSDEPAVEESLDRTNGSTFRIGAYTLGYTRDLDLIRNVEMGLGFNISTYLLPEAIKPYYGNRPIGVNMFLRFRLRPAG